MFKTFLLITIVAITLCLGEEKTRYDDYSVVRVYGINGTDVQSFYDLNIDVWATQNSEDSWADLMLHQDQLSRFLDLYPRHKIVLENVQTELDRHYEENEKARANSVGLNAFDYFPPYADVLAYLNEMVRDYPNVAALVNIGRTYQGTLINGISLGVDSNRPLYFIHCTIHAREWITTTTCCYIIEQLLTVDTTLLQDFHWIIVPVFNIDGYSFSHTNTRLWRKNRQPNSGTCVGTDLNRNYQIGFAGPGSGPNQCDETYRGSRYFSAPETQAEFSFLSNYAGPIAAFVDIHSYGGYFMSAWGDTYTLPPDYSAMNSLMINSVNAIRAVNGNSYYYGSSANTIYLAAGGSIDTAYGTSLKIIPSFTIECAGTSFTAPISQILPIGREVWAGCKALANAVRTQ